MEVYTCEFEWRFILCNEGNMFILSSEFEHELVQNLNGTKRRCIPTVNLNDGLFVNQDSTEYFSTYGKNIEHYF
jgi:hypothetical protein